MNRAVQDLVTRALADVQGGRPQTEDVAVVITLLERYRRAAAGFERRGPDDPAIAVLGDSWADADLLPEDVGEILQLTRATFAKMSEPTLDLSLIASASEDSRAIPLLLELLTAVETSLKDGRPRDSYGATQLLRALEASAEPATAHPVVRRFARLEGDVGDYARYLETL